MTIRSFLTDVASNPQTLSAWKKHKEAAMKSAGLSDSDMQTLRSGDPKKIMAAMGGPAAADTTIILIFW